MILIGASVVPGCVVALNRSSSGRRATWLQREGCTSEPDVRHSHGPTHLISKLSPFGIKASVLSPGGVGCLVITTVFGLRGLKYAAMLSGVTVSAGGVILPCCCRGVVWSRRKIRRVCG